MPSHTRRPADGAALLAEPVPMSDDAEGQTPDGLPTGLAMWGQAAVYNAVDDRLVISAVTDNLAGGMVRPCAVSAGSGLTLNIAAGWLAVASCGDGTNMVIGARQSHTIAETAGSPTASRNDLLWADTYPDDGRWICRVIREDQMPGRAGLPLARITVPAGANLASQMTFSGNVHSISPKVDSDPRNNHGTTAWEHLTPEYPFAVHGMRRDSMYRLTAYGGGDVGSGTTNMNFTAGHVEVSVNPGSIGLNAGNRLFDWEAQAVTVFGHRFAQGVGNTKLTVTVSRRGLAGPNTSLTVVGYTRSAAFGTSPWLQMHLAMRFTGGVLPNANIDCQSSAFETVAKPW